MNDHQRFTGINLPDGQAGTWKSLCGADCNEIVEVYLDVVGVGPTQAQIGDAKWVMGGAVFYGGTVKCRSLAEFREWLIRQHDDTVDDSPVANGLRHDWTKAKGAWLYPGDPDYWIASHRLMTWPTEKIARYLSHPEVAPMTHVVVCCNTGTRPETYERPFDGLKNIEKVEAVYRQIIEADKAPITWLMSQEFFQQKLGRKHDKLLDHLRETASLVEPWSQIMVPFRELGEIYDGRHMSERNDIFKAIRKGAAKVAIAEHERGLVEVPVDDWRDVGGTVVSGLQTGFNCPTGGSGRPQDQVTAPGGGHAYDGACGFVQTNQERMDGYASRGHILERHVNACFEHSLPLVYEGQYWKPTRTLSEAQSRGKTILKHGAAFELGGGAVR
jgi:hypothetical protein